MLKKIPADFNSFYGRIIITGDIEEISTLRFKIKHPGLFVEYTELFTFLRCCVLLRSPINTINFEVLSIRSPLETPLAFLSSMYPNLTIEVVYEETSYGLYGRAVFQKGKLTADEQFDEYNYLLRYCPEFSSEIKKIGALSIKAFKKRYIFGEKYQEEDVWILYNHILSPVIFGRVDNTDLPILAVRDSYIGRLAKDLLASRRLI